MNVFRLVLCLAGLLTFLAVRHFSPPAHSPPGESISGELSRGLYPGPHVSVSFVPPLDVLGRFEVSGKIVLLKQGAEGFLYSVNSGSGEVLVDNVPELEFRQRDPELFELVQTAQRAAPQPNSFLSLQARPAGRSVDQP